MLKTPKIYLIKKKYQMVIDARLKSTRIIDYQYCLTFCSIPISTYYAANYVELRL